MSVRYQREMGTAVDPGELEGAYDVVIVGGGPAGLAAALMLGRARKRVLLCDAGPRRNATAEQIHNFVTRDGTPPEEFRQIARAQLEPYASVSVVEQQVSAISGARGAFQVELATKRVGAHRILLCTGMIDESLELEGFRELWGHSIFQCPYCHGFEVQDRRWGYLVLPASAGHAVPFALQARGWSREVTLFTNGVVELSAEALAQIRAGKVRVETAPVTRLIANGRNLEAIELANGTRVPCDALFAHPPQRQVELVRALGVALEDDGSVRIEPMKRETSIPGIYAGGDLTTRAQSAVFAASSAVQAAAMINVELTIELATNGML